jgi:hypothetical protein
MQPGSFGPKHNGVIYMFKRILATLLFAVLSAPAFAGPGMVREVHVEADLSSIKDADAAKFWTNLPADLQNAIVARLTDRVDSEKGSVDILVNVDTVKLANAWKSPVANSELSGHVVSRDSTDAAHGNVYDLTVTMDQAKVFLPENMAVATVMTDSKEYYDAMIAAFADAVVKDYRKN